MNNKKARTSRDNFESVRKNKKVNKARNTFISVLLLLCIFIVGVYVCYEKYFIIEKCKIEGDIPYTPDEVLEGLGFEKGMNLYELSGDKINENALYNLPHIDTFKVSRKWPDTIVVKATAALPSMYITLDNRNFVLSQSLRVLSETRDFSYIESHSLVSVIMSDVKKCVAGEYLETNDNSEKIVLEIYKCLQDAGIIGYVNEIDVSDKFDITFKYKSSFEVVLGDAKNLSKKIDFMKGIESKLHDGSSGIIDVSDENVKEGIVKSFT